jgi:hypothetical protein
LRHEIDEPVVGGTGSALASVMDETILRRIAEAIWSTNGSPARLLDEIARPDSDLNRQQSKCWKQARAVYAALFT